MGKIKENIVAEAMKKFRKKKVMQINEIEKMLSCSLITVRRYLKQWQTISQQQQIQLEMQADYVYGRTRNERLVQTAERVGEMVWVEERRAGSVPEHSDATAGNEGYTQVSQDVKAGLEFMPKGGFEPPRYRDQQRHASYCF